MLNCKHVFLLIVLVQYAQAACRGGCWNPQRMLYETLDCQPIKRTPFACCPYRYDCSNLQKVPANKCHYMGKIYNQGETIKYNETTNNCQSGCVCNAPHGFSCPIIHCPIIKPSPCLTTYKLDKCCALGSTCSTQKLAKCNVEGTSYLEGQLFNHPYETCVSCVCKKDFDGYLGPPNCRKETCASEIYNSKEIHGNCAAAFATSTSCCPYKWICPSKDIKIQPTQETDSYGDMKCIFGTKIIDFGASFVKDDVLCKCSLPPLVTCVRKN